MTQLPSRPLSASSWPVKGGGARSVESAASCARVVATPARGEPRSRPYARRLMRLRSLPHARTLPRSTATRARSTQGARVPRQRNQQGSFMTEPRAPRVGYYLLCSVYYYLLLASWYWPGLSWILAGEPVRPHSHSPAASPSAWHPGMMVARRLGLHQTVHCSMSTLAVRCRLLAHPRRARPSPHFVRKGCV